MPYLFLVVAKGLSTLLQKVDSDSRVKGVYIAPSELSINHLFFADDNLLFCDAKFDQVEELKRIFCVYDTASRQHINFLKYAMRFSPSTHVALQSQLQVLLGVPVVPCHERYLGLPTMASKNKKIYVLCY